MFQFHEIFHYKSQVNMNNFKIILRSIEHLNFIAQIKIA